VGENPKEELLRSRGGKGEGLWKKGMKMPPLQDSFPLSVPSPSPSFTGEPIFHTLFARDTEKEAKRLCKTRHHRPSPGLRGTFIEKCN